MRLVESAYNLFGRVDILVNGAGVALKIGPLEQFSDAEFRTIMETNVYGAFYAMRSAIPVYEAPAQRDDRECRLAGGQGWRGEYRAAVCRQVCAYPAFRRRSATSCARTIFMSPPFSAGMINTDIHPLNPSEEFRRQLMTAHDIAEAVLWVCTLPPSLRVDELPLMPPSSRCRVCLPAAVWYSYFSSILFVRSESAQTNYRRS